MMLKTVMTHEFSKKITTKKNEIFQATLLKTVITVDYIILQQ